jgi:glyoxylase-like metal-dependent hydrolase (beta-lactamase superfamily II)
MGAIGDAKKLLESDSEHERDYAKIFTGYLTGIINSGSSLDYRTPGITFDDRLNINGADRRLEIIEFRNGHSESDCVLHLPDDNVVFCGDLCYVGYHPCLDMGDPLNQLKILDQLKLLGAEKVVPGHGYVGGVESFEHVDEYIHALKKLVKEVIDSGGSIEEIESIPVPEQYIGLQMEGFFYRRNLRGLYKLLAKTC